MGKANDKADEKTKVQLIEWAVFIDARLQRRKHTQHEHTHYHQFIDEKKPTESVIIQITCFVHKFNPMAAILHKEPSLLVVMIVWVALLTRSSFICACAFLFVNSILYRE